MIGRRHFIKTGLASTAAFLVEHRGAAALEQKAYPATAKTLEQARGSEADASRQYVAFSNQAKGEGYPGIAYLFTSLATAEFIHGQNFEKVLFRLGVEVAPPPQREVPLAATRKNLLKAAADELESVLTFYPGILEQLQAEKFQDAITMTKYAWESEKQHLNILKAIQRWTPDHFEEVAKKIENETGQYFVCQICGSTAVQIPRANCSICKFPSENYRKIEPSA